MKKKSKSKKKFIVEAFYVKKLLLGQIEEENFRKRKDVKLEKILGILKRLLDVFKLLKLKTSRKF